MGGKRRNRGGCLYDHLDVVWNAPHSGQRSEIKFSKLVAYGGCIMQNTCLRDIHGLAIVSLSDWTVPAVDREWWTGKGGRWTINTINHASPQANTPAIRKTSGWCTSGAPLLNGDVATLCVGCDRYADAQSTSTSLRSGWRMRVVDGNLKDVQR